MAWTLLDRHLRGFDPFPNLFGDLVRSTMQGPNVESALGLARAWVGENEALVEFELPGVDPASIDVSVEGADLRVRGERKLPALADGEHYHRRERFEGRFDRRLAFPFRIDAEHVEAVHKNGLLELRLPRAPEDRPRRIAVKNVAERAKKGE
jgi:HSP20 family protein